MLSHRVLPFACKSQCRSYRCIVSSPSSLSLQASILDQPLPEFLAVWDSLISSFLERCDGHTAVELAFVCPFVARFIRGPNVGMQAEMIPVETSTEVATRPPMSLS